MKTLRQLFATMLLVLTICFAAYAGDLSGPTGSPTPPPTPSSVTDPLPRVLCGAGTPIGDIDLNSLAMVTANLMLGALPIYY